jgi:hypothetical protein
VTDEERLQLQRETVARIHATHGPSLRGKPSTSRGRVAVRYAALTRCSLREAARTIGVSHSQVCRAWRDVYPGVAAPRGWV